jgi:hypothetical protein
MVSYDTEGDWDAATENIRLIHTSYGDHDEGALELGHPIFTGSSKWFTNDGLEVPFEALNEPVGVYDGTADKTFVVYAGPEQDPYAAEYYHSSGSWTSPVKIGTNPLSGDHHGTPAIIQDDTGVLHSLYGVHGGNGSLTHSKSDNANDATSWTEQGTILSNCTYPSMFNIDGDLFVVLRFYNSGEKNQTGYIVSTDDGSTWSAKNLLLTQDTDSWSYHHGVEVEGTNIHLALHRNVRATDVTQNLYYLRYETGTDTLYTADGTDLGAPPIDSTTFYNNCKVLDSGGNHLAQADVRIDGSGNPHILYTEDDGGNKWKYIFWTGSSWSTPSTIVSKGSSNFTAGVLTLEAADDLTAWVPTEQNDRQGDIEQWMFDGVSWSKITTVFDNANWGSGAGDVRPIRNFNNELEILFPQTDPDDFSNADRKVFGYGSEGYVRNRNKTIQGIHAQWTCDESTGPLVDVSGNGHDATVSSGISLGETGVFGTTAAKSDGTEYVNLGTLGDFGSRMATEDFIVRFWVKTTHDSKGHFLGRNDGKQYMFISTGDYGSPGSLEFNIKDDGGSVWQVYLDSATANINDGSWHRVLVQKTGTSGAGDLQIAIDGTVYDPSIINDDGMAYDSTHNWNGSVYLFATHTPDGNMADGAAATIDEPGILVGRSFSSQEIERDGQLSGSLTTDWRQL